MNDKKQTIFTFPSGHMYSSILSNMQKWDWESGQNAECDETLNIQGRASAVPKKTVSKQKT